jgi:hypothetical protein
MQLVHQIIALNQKELALDMVPPHEKQVADKLIHEFAAKADFHTAEKIIKKFKFNSLDYPDVDLHIRLKTPLFNDFFLDPWQKRYLPYHCLEELIIENKKM